MEIFICWSGLRSLAAAKAIDQWLPKLVPQITISYSERIEKGSVWFAEIGERLGRADAGLICVTAESVRSAWLHYEAGVLAAHLKAGGRRSIYTYLIGLDPRELGGSPLAAYQSTLPTYEDTGRLIEALAGTPLPEHYQSWWRDFSDALGDVELVSLEAVWPDFAKRFSRKTFDEPLNECGDQRWLDRYNGARDTLQLLRDQSDKVRIECQTYVVDLYQELVAELDGYTAHLSATVLSEKRFSRDKEGRLAIDPVGAQLSCERRRKRIKSLVADLLDPHRKPIFEEAARFGRMETFEEKKNLIHRKTEQLLGRAGEAKRNSSTALACFRHFRQPFSREEIKRAQSSDWEFDRIMSYVIEECDSPSVAEACSSVSRELEKFLSKTSEASLMPLYYSLGPLAKAVLSGVPVAEDREELEGLLSRIEQKTNEGNRRGRLNERIAEIKRLLHKNTAGFSRDDRMARDGIVRETGRSERSMST